MIVELETDIVRLENILGDTDQKEQDHLLWSPPTALLAYDS